LGVEPHVIDAVLNHKSRTIKGMAAVYNRYPYLLEMRAALELWAGVIRGFVRQLNAKGLPVDARPAEPVSARQSETGVES
jgi:hypothetical protein